MEKYGCQRIRSSYWLLVIGYWLLVVGYWLLVIGYQLLVLVRVYRLICLVSLVEQPNISTDKPLPTLITNN